MTISRIGHSRKNGSQIRKLREPVSRTRTSITRGGT
jgi:hypothetical protein